MSPTIYSYVSIPQDSDKVWKFIRNHKHFEEHVGPMMMSVKINYMTKGFVKYEHFKEMYVDLLNWRRANSFSKNENEKENKKSKKIRMVDNVD